MVRRHDVRLQAILLAWPRCAHTGALVPDRRKVFMSPEAVKLGLRGSNWTANPHAWGLVKQRSFPAEKDLGSGRGLTRRPQWPTIVGMKPGGKLVNGGVPQNGNLSLHLATIREDFATPWPQWQGQRLFPALEKERLRS